MLRVLYICLPLCGAAIGLDAQNQLAPPPNSVALSANTYISATEVSNAQYQQMLDWVAVRQPEGTQSEVYKSLQPNYAAWSQLAGADAMGIYYHTHAAYTQYPVVNVSYRQALAYCSWLSARETEKAYFAAHPNETFDPAKDYSYLPATIQYRLPSQAEWEQAAAANLDVQQYPYGYKKIPTKGSDAPNCQDTRELIPNVIQLTAPITAGNANALGCYNMIGNVAEMVQEPNIAKGGSFRQPLDQCRIADQQSYSAAAAWLGFRCVAVLNQP